MKRVTALFLAFVLSTTCLTACGNQTAGSADGSATPSTLSQSALAQPTYPKLASYPNENDYAKSNGDFDSDGFQAAYDAWQADQQKQQNQPKDYQDGLNQFCATHLSAFFQGDQKENQICSPLNLYLALGMLTEVTSGDSQKQILQVLGSDDQTALRKQISALWNANYNDDGTVTSRLAASLWLNEDVSYQQKTLDALAQHYYTSTFQGKMGSDAYNKALQNWLNEQTGGMLKEQAKGVTLEPETLLALATTLYYRAQWVNQFDKSNTKQDTFHGSNGDVTCDFLHQSGTDNYFWGKRFSAVAQSLENSGSMWFFRPEDGVNPEELLQDEQVQKLLTAPDDWKQTKYLTVNRSIPKFDVASDLNLRESLNALGITDVFDPEKADFSPLTQDKQPAYLSQAKHAARVTIDEDGCTAAAFTVVSVDAMSALPAEEVDFVLDRPFLFVLTGADGSPLFVGIVRQPA